MLWLYPFAEPFEFDSDEGVNVMKALLVARGHALYSEVWNDQPPLWTWLLRAWFGLWGWDVTAGRRLVLLFAATMVFALYDILRLAWGHGAALVGAALLCASSYFLYLSVAIMVGLPALATALLGVWALFQWRRRGRTQWLVLGGTLFGLSLTMKLFTALLTPWLALWLIIGGRRRQYDGARPGLWPVGVFLAVAAVVSGSVLIAGVGLQHVNHLLAAHLAARRMGIASGAAAADAAMLWANVGRDWEIFALGAVGLVCMLVRRRFALLIFPAWAAAAAYALATHSPLWYHHHLLLSVPVSACAGVAAGELFTRRPWPRLRAGGLAPAVARLTAAVGLAVLAAALLQGRKREDTSLLVSSDRDRFAVEVMREYADETHWVLADRPMFPFRAGLTTPPNIAVFTHKRIVTGALTSQDLVDAVDRFQPEQVVLTWKTPPHLARELVRAMEGRYRAVLTDSERFRLHLYVRRRHCVRSSAAPATCGRAYAMGGAGAQRGGPAVGRAWRHRASDRSPDARPRARPHVLVATRSSCRHDASRGSSEGGLCDLARGAR